MTINQPKMKKEMRVILDLRGLVIHGFYSGVPEDTVPNAKGERVPSAAHGVKKFIDIYLTPILESFAPIQIIAVVEGGNHRRRALYSEYKNKPAQDADDPILTLQRDLAYEAVQKLLLGLGALLVKTPSVEADDTIAYLCERLPGGKIIHTVDGDLTQLYGPDVSLLVKGEHVTSYKGMDFEAGVPPAMVRMYKSIVGDSSDGYGGVKGMGEKAWATLVSTYGYDGLLELEHCVATANYDAMIASLVAEPDKCLQKLYDSRDEWRLSYLLASLHPEWCETSFQDRVIRPQWGKRVPTVERITKVLEPLGLDTLIPKLRKFCVQKFGVDKNKLGSINLNKMIAQMRQSLCVPFDYESYDSVKHPEYQQARAGYVDVLNQKITGCSFAFGNNLQYATYFSFNHRDTANLPLSVLEQVFDGIDVPESEADLVAHNFTFEGIVTKTNLNREFKRSVYDTRVMSSYADENQPDGLKDLSQHYLNYKQTRYEEVVPKDGDMRDVSLDEVLDYGCDDSICTAHLYVLFRTILLCERTWDFYSKYEPAFDRVMMKSYITGVPINYERLSELRQEDEALRAKTLLELRTNLKEHCSEINVEGFTQLWKEIEPYERGKLAEKEEEGKIDQEAIEIVIAEKKQQMFDACRYVDLSAPKLDWRKHASLSRVARSLGFPGIRSNKGEWLRTYATGIVEQAGAQGYVLTSHQTAFLEALLQAADDVKLGVGDEFEALAAVCQELLEADPTLWEGDELNIDSPKQMAELFYGKMCLPILMRNIDKTGDSKRSQWEMEQAPSTNVLAIETWIAEINDENDWRHKVLKAVLTLRAISTRFKLYYNPYPLFKSPVDGRIHPGIKNCGTQTRRPSGTSPNILQVSKKDDGKMRSVFEPLADDHIIVSIDFVQQELVILAGLSDDANLRSCYQGNNKRDVHSLTGTAILNVQRGRKGLKGLSYEEYSKLIKDKDKEATNIRKKPAKITNFLTVYGGSAGGLARKAVVPRAMAEEFLAAFFSTYPKVGDYQERTVRFAQRHGFVLTCYGNRKHCTGIFDKNKAIAAAWERQAVNQPIQGGAADVLKVVMYEIENTRLLEETGAVIYAPVYDEIVSSVPIANVFEYCERLATIMEIDLPGLNIRLDTSVSIGRNWGDQIEIGTRPTREKIEQTLNDIFNPKEAEVA